MQFIKNLITKIKISLDRDPGKIVIHPGRVWMFMFVVFFAINLVIASFSFYFFKSVSNDSPATSADETNGSLNTISREKLNQGLDYLHKKDTNFEYIKNHKPTIIDPSR